MSGYALFGQRNAGFDIAALLRADAGVVTVIALAVVPPNTFATNDVLGLSIINNQLRSWRNGVQGLRGSDPVYVDSGRIGLSMENTTGRWDDFGGGTLTFQRGNDKKDIPFQQHFRR